MVILIVLAISIGDWMGKPSNPSPADRIDRPSAPIGTYTTKETPDIVYPADTVLPGVDVGFDSIMTVLESRNVAYRIANGDPVQGLPNMIISYPHGLVQIIGDTVHPFEITLAGEPTVVGTPIKSNHPMYSLAEAIDPSCLNFLREQDDSIRTAGMRADSVVNIEAGLRMVGRHTYMGGGNMMMLTVSSDQTAAP